MIEVGPSLFHASGRRCDAITASLVAISVVRDEMWRLPFFLAYHRWLGVQHFIVIDNRSTDGTPDFLQREPDVTCVLAPGDYGTSYGRDWMSWALRQAPPERWNALLDADELFVPPALETNGLLALARDLVAERVAIAAASLVDCYPPLFPPDSRHFEPIPWKRAPCFDCGPYFEWPLQGGMQPRYTYRGVRERVCWPHWRWARHVRKLVPRPLRPHRLHDSPPWVAKMPLLRNVAELRLQSVHHSNGAPLSRSLHALLHYKLDIDLPAKVHVALRERQHSHGSREYEGYARLLAGPSGDLRYKGTRRFEGVNSLVDAGLASFNVTNSERTDPSRLSLGAIADQVARYGDAALQRKVWSNAWGSVRACAA